MVVVAAAAAPTACRRYSLQSALSSWFTSLKPAAMPYMCMFSSGTAWNVCCCLECMLPRCVCVGGGWGWGLLGPGVLGVKELMYIYRPSLAQHPEHGAVRPPTVEDRKSKVRPGPCQHCRGRAGSGIPLLFLLPRHAEGEWLVQPRCLQVFVQFHHRHNGTSAFGARRRSAGALPPAGGARWPFTPGVGY